ncbi:MAG TPA: nicotinamide riboside transporter PnuC [Pyrinomonadaceae bacterium]
MLEFFSVNKIAFTLLGYPMSYIEFCGTLLYLWSVWLMVRRRIWTWPVGILSVLLYAALFYQIRLYSDALEQLYYLCASLYGWWHWRAARAESGAERRIAVGYSSARSIVAGVLVTLALSAALGALVADVHRLLPAVFPEPASYPFLDALTTIMSFTAMWLLARARIESWFYWIVVDAVGIWLYYVKGVRFIALLYVVLLAMAIGGLASWLRAARAAVKVRPA